MFAGCVLAWPAPLAGGRGRPQGLLKHGGFGPHPLRKAKRQVLCTVCGEALSDRFGFCSSASKRRKPQDLHVSNVKIWGMGPCPMFTQSPCPSRHGLCEHARTEQPTSSAALESNAPSAESAVHGIRRQFLRQAQLVRAFAS